MWTFARLETLPDPNRFWDKKALGSPIHELDINVKFFTHRS
jgi:hypothetical protein